MTADEINNVHPHMLLTPAQQAARAGKIMRLIILHDAENCYIPSSLQKETALFLHQQTIRVILETLLGRKDISDDELRKYDVEWRFYLKRKYNNQHQPNRDFLNAFSGIAGVEVIEPGEESTVDDKIKRALDTFAKYPVADTALVLLGGDRDYCGHVRNLRQCDHKPIVVLLHNGSARPTLKTLATYSSPRWTEVIDRARKSSNSDASSSASSSSQPSSPKEIESPIRKNHMEDSNVMNNGNVARSRSDEGRGENSNSSSSPPLQPMATNGGSGGGSSRRKLPERNEHLPSPPPKGQAARGLLPIPLPCAASAVSKNTIFRR